MDCSTPGSPVLHHLPEVAQIHFHWIDDAIQPSHPPSSPRSPAFNLSQHQGFFSNESALPIRWSKYWSFGFSISPSNEYSGLISFRIAWFDLLTVQGTLKSLLQNHNSKASILWHLAFFMIQLSHLYMTTGKTRALTLWTFVDRGMSLHFIMLSRFVIAFLLLSPSVDQALPWGYLSWKAGLSTREHLPWGQDHPALPIRDGREGGTVRSEQRWSATKWHCSLAGFSVCYGFRIRWVD